MSDPVQNVPSNVGENGSNIIDFRTLNQRIPYSARSLRDAVRKGLIPSIVLPGGRKRLFHWPSVEAALKRLQQAAV
jgi:hypothetical protein